MSNFDNPSSRNPNSRVHFTIEHDGLEPNTTYYYAAYLYNYQCTSPRYTEAVTASVMTSTSAPDSLWFTAITEDAIRLQSRANEQDENILVMVTDQRGGEYAGITLVPKYVGKFGVPPMDAKVGDTVWTTESGTGNTVDTVFGGKVLYVGPADGEIIFTGDIIDNHIYHFGAFSKREDGGYSSVFAQADTLSKAKIPFQDNFVNMVTSEENPFIGWNGTKGFSLQQSGYPEITSGSAVASIGGDTLQEVILALPPLDFPEDQNALLEINYSLSPYSIDLGDGDSIVFEVSADQGRSYQIVEAVTQYSTSMSLSEIPIIGYSGLPDMRIRLRYVSHGTTDHTLSVNRVNVSALALCDVPSRPTVSTSGVIGGNVPIRWSASLNEESLWNFCYAQKEGESFGNWSSEIQISGTPAHVLADLEGNSVYKVRVQAICAGSLRSEWVESNEFVSGPVPSFTEDFNDLTLEEDYYGDTNAVLPAYWESYYYYSYGASDPYQLPDTMNTSDSYSIDQQFYDWKTTTSVEPGVSNGALAWEMNAYDGTRFLQLPNIQLLEEEGPHTLEFDMVYGMVDVQNGFTTVEQHGPAAYRLALYVSVDSGRSFVMTNPLRIWDSVSLISFDGNTPVSIDLSEYKGVISLVFGISSLEGESAPAHILYIDNLHVGCACPVAKNVRVEELDETTVSLRWNRDEDVEEWLVKVVGNGQQEIYTSTETSYTMGDLTAATEYTVSVGHLCGADTSAWTSISFTTAGAECAPVSNPEVSNITRNSAVLSWSGSASDYRIRIREVSDEPVDWGYYLVQGAQSYTLPLEMATRYEGGVQALCNPLAGDTSEYVDFEPFTTLALTCFAPSNLIPTVVDHQSIQLSWTGESNAYQVEWQRRMGGTPAGSAIVDNANEYLVEGLEPETTYEFHIRSICSEGDTSDWSSYVMATTGIRPPCPAPTNLRVESITETSASLLWDTEEDASSFLLRHRATNVMAWDSVRDLSETQYNLAGLEPNTAYAWSVLMACTDGRYSGWATQNNFTTEETANETLAGNGLSVTASKGQIHVMNPSAVQIERIRVYNLSGTMMEEYVVRSDGNVILTTGLSTQVAIVEILLDANQAVRFKVLIP